MKNKIVITGGAGFIGSHIAEECVERNYEVVVVDNLQTGSLDNLKLIKDKITFIEGDIRDLELLEKIFEGASCVIHQAALVSVPESINSPILSNEINALGTLNVFEAAKRKKVLKIVYASSSAVYGNLNTFPILEDYACIPLSPYALQKKIAEEYAKLYFDLFNISSIGLRYFNVYGPRQKAESSYSGVVPKFVKALLSGDSPHIYGDGSATRDFIFVKDVAKANVDACEFLLNNSSYLEVVNIGSGEETTVNSLAEMVEEIMEKDAPIIYEPKREGDIQRSVANIDKVKKTLIFEPKVPIKEGLFETINWYKNLFN